MCVGGEGGKGKKAPDLFDYLERSFTVQSKARPKNKNKKGTLSSKENKTVHGSKYHH